jgi:hypothetical protein
MASFTLADPVRFRVNPPWAARADHFLEGDWPIRVENKRF